ncbi:MAG: hypothetical protein AB8H80_03110 [Planctomycetota bacterium]
MSIIPHPAAYAEGEGHRYASHLAERAQALSFVFSILGWLLVVAGALFAICGSLAGSQDPGGSSNSGSIFDLVEAHRGIAYSALAIVLLGLGWQILDRAAAATRAASCATVAIMTSSDPREEPGLDADRVAYEACVQAKAAWLDGRLSRDRLDSIVGDLRAATPAASSQAPAVSTSRSGAQPG